jgi:hypothetical protein
VTPTSPWLVVLRSGVLIEDPLSVVFGFLVRWHLDVSDPSQSASFGEPDLRLANRGGARVYAAQIAAILQRRAPIERALCDRSRRFAFRTGESGAVAAAEAALRRVRRDPRSRPRQDDQGAAPKAPSADPNAQRHLQEYLADDDPGAQVPFGRRALELKLERCYKSDPDRTSAAVRRIRQELAGRGYDLTEVPDPRPADLVRPGCSLIGWPDGRYHDAALPHGVRNTTTGVWQGFPAFS